MYQNRLSLLLICLFSLNIAHNQEQVILFPGQTGNELVQSLVSDYKPSTVLNYEEAREAMYKYIWNAEDSVRCVYTSHALPLSPDASNPIFQLSMFGSLNGIICEHTYPRSKGAETGNALSDMHHLVPARLGANLARNNFPFVEIPDQETSLWLYKTESSGNIPSSNIDLYSEQKIGVFEPREDFKGNIARNIFYFFTMYRAEAMAADPDFFEEQRPFLCEWHYLDPIDETEQNRSQQIAEYQDGMPNPFALDCTLPYRTYCSEFENLCTTVATDNLAQAALQFQAYPNPAAESTTISFELENPLNVKLEVFDLLGRKLMGVAEGLHQAGQHEYNLTAPESLNSNIVVCRMILSDGQQSAILQRRIFFQ